MLLFNRKCFAHIEKISQVTNVRADNISDRSARVEWEADVGVDYAQVEYYIVFYGNDNEALDARSAGMLL